MLNFLKNFFFTAGIFSILFNPILYFVGFTSTGVATGSWAAFWQATYGGFVPLGGIFALLQSAATKVGLFTQVGLGGLTLGGCFQKLKDLFKKEEKKEKKVGIHTQIKDLFFQKKQK